MSAWPKLFCRAEATLRCMRRGPARRGHRPAGCSGRACGGSAAAAQRRRGAAAEAEAAAAGGLPALRVRRSRQRPQVLARHWPGPGPAGRRRTSARSVRIDVSCAMSWKSDRSKGFRVVPWVENQIVQKLKFEVTTFDASINYSREWD